jgi:hypothetical protein
MAAMSNDDLMQTLRRGLTRSKPLFAIHRLATAAMRNLSRHAASTQELPRLLHDDVAIRPIAIRC